MRSSKLGPLLFAVMLMMFLVNPVLSQDLRVDPSANDRPEAVEDPEALYREAFSNFVKTGFGQSDATMRYLAENYRGTDVGLRALQFLAENAATLEEIREFHQQIISDFPDTEHETESRLDLLDLEFAAAHDKEAYVQACSALPIQIGGPSFEEITISGVTEESLTRIRSMGPENQRRLLSIYTAIWTTVYEDYPSFIEGDTGDPDTALSIIRFLRQNFEPLELDYNGMYHLRHALGLDVTEAYRPQTFVDPQMSFISPEAESRTGPTPSVRAEISVGDLGKRQVSLETLKVTLDGVNVKSEARFELRYGPLQPGAVFEFISISYTPSIPLSEGPHEFTLEASAYKYPGEGPGRTVATLNFTVFPENSDQSRLPSKDPTLNAPGNHRNGAGGLR